MIANPQASSDFSGVYNWSTDIKELEVAWKSLS